MGNSVPLEQLESLSDQSPITIMAFRARKLIRAIRFGVNLDWPQIAATVGDQFSDLVAAMHNYYLARTDQPTTDGQSLDYYIQAIISADPNVVSAVEAAIGIQLKQQVAHEA